MTGDRGRAWAAALLAVGVCACDEGAPVASLGLGRPPPSAPPAHVVGGFSLQLPPVDLDPGEEKTICYLAPIELSGASRIIGGGLLTVTEGMHHGNVTTRAKTGEGVRICPDETDGAAALNVVKGGAV